MSISSEISRLTQAKADIKTAIESKGVTVPTNAKLDDYPELIDDIEQGGGGGGGGETAKEKDVNFIDYDGTILHSYTAEEFLALTEMPENPTHEGLTSQGWNWTLSDAKEQVQSTGMCYIGQMYVTESGDTEIDVSFADTARLSPILTIAVNGTIEVDWGDGTSKDTVSGSSLTSRKSVPHTYSNIGDYTIKITALSGKYAFYGSNSYTILRKNTTQNENRVYTNCVKSLRFGSNITAIGDYALYNCFSLLTITIPNGITSIGTNAFQYCYSLLSITIPSGVTSIGNYAFGSCLSLSSIAISSRITTIGQYAFISCYSLASITIPSEVTSIGNYAFQYCFSLASITIPSEVTSIGNYAFADCYSLQSMVIPSGVTSIGTNAFADCYSLQSMVIPSGVTSIGTNAFQYCYSLASITIPSEVTSIGNYAFYYCCGFAVIHAISTSPPALNGSKVFQGIPSDCKIHVPAESLEDYKAAQYWSTYASNMIGE